MQDPQAWEQKNKALFLAEIAELERSTERGHFLLAGRSWSDRMMEPDGSGYLALREGERTIQLRAAWTKPGFRWEWCLKLADDVYFRLDGGADSLENAAAASLAVAPEFYELEYLGRTWRWWVAGEERWLAEVDGEEAEVFFLKAGYAGDQDRYCWTRRCRAAAEVLDQIDGSYRGLRGRAATKEAAFRGCVDAPDRFLRACGALVSKCSELRKSSRVPELAGQADQVQAGAGRAQQPELAGQADQVQAGEAQTEGLSGSNPAVKPSAKTSARRGGRRVG